MIPFSSEQLNQYLAQQPELQQLVEQVSDLWEWLAKFSRFRVFTAAYEGLSATQRQELARLGSVGDLLKTGLFSVGGFQVVDYLLGLDFRDPNVLVVKKPDTGETGWLSLASPAALARDDDAGYQALRAYLIDSPNHRIQDVFRWDDYIGIVVDPFDGQSLRHAAESRQKPYTNAEIVDIGTRLCDLVARLHAYANPIIHRKIADSTVWMNAEGGLLITDYALIEISKNAGQKYVVDGVDGFSAPEQYRGYSDIRTDVYAVGALLHMLATGVDPCYQPPFAAAEHIPHIVNDQISERVSGVILRAAAFEPEARYQTIEQLRDDLAGR